MHDKVVRRRRAVLALLVALSLFLLTAYFGESAGGGLHATQRGALEVLAPIQEGANKALKPARDLFGWFGDTLDAQDERDRLQRERDQLRGEVAQLQVARPRARAAQGPAGDQHRRRPRSSTTPVTSRVYQRSPSTWYQTVTINKGSSDGVKVDDPVVNGQGLVGKVKSVSDGNAVVMLLTDQDFGVSALAPRRGEPGSITPIPGAGGDLLFDLVDDAEKIRTGDLVVTAGTSSERLPSVYPRSILIGKVKRIDNGDGDLDRRIHVSPAADLLHLDIVQVLTKPDANLQADATPTAP